MACTSTGLDLDKPVLGLALAWTCLDLDRFEFGLALIWIGLDRTWTGFAWTGFGLDGLGLKLAWTATAMDLDKLGAA